MKKLSIFFIFPAILSLSLFFLSGCHSSKESTKSANTVKVGITTKVGQKMLEAIQALALEKYNINLAIVQIKDKDQLNKALIEHQIDANVFQYAASVEEENREHNYKIVAIGKTFIYPMGVYSNKITTLSELPNDAIVAIPSEPINEGRALGLLEKGGLITVDGEHITASTANISKNIKNLIFKAYPAQDVAKMLPYVDIAVINLPFALEANLRPHKDSILTESAKSPYASMIVVRSEDQNDPDLQNLVKALNSPEAEKAAKEIFQGEAIPAWK